MHDVRNGGDEFGYGRTGKGFAVHFDDSRERKCDVENADPRVGFVLDVTRCGPFVGIDTHEKLTSLRELVDELPVVSDELLYRFVVAEITEIAEHRHEAFRFERESIHIDISLRMRRKYDAFVLDLVREERCDDCKEARHHHMLSNNVKRNRWNGEKLESEVFDGGLCFTVDQEICINNAVVHICKMRCYGELVNCVIQKVHVKYSPTASLCSWLNVKIDA